MIEHKVTALLGVFAIAVSMSLFVVHM